MTCYVVTTYLANSVVTRQRVVDVLKSNSSGYCPIHPNAWAILTAQSAAAVRDAVMAVIGPSDRVFVIRSGTEAAWNATYGPKNVEWLKKNL